MDWLSDFDLRPVEGSSPPVLLLTGEIDQFVLPKVRNGVLAGMDTAPGELRVDLSGVPFIDGAGMHSLIDLTEEGSRLGCRLILRNPSRPVRRLIDLVDRSHVLRVEDEDDRDD